MAIQDEVVRLRKENRALKKYLIELSDTCVACIGQIDYLHKAEVWRSLPVVRRGEIMAEIRNRLDMSTDMARHFGLGYSFAKDERLKKKIRESCIKK